MDHEEVESRARAGERAAWRRESEARVADHLLRQPPQLVAFSSSPSVQKLNIVFGNAGVGNGNPAKNALLFGDGHGRFVLDSLFSELASRATRGRSPRATSTAMGTSISWLATTRPTPPSHRARTSSSSGTARAASFRRPTGGQHYTRALSVADANGDGKLVQLQDTQDSLRDASETSLRDSETRVSRSRPLCPFSPVCLPRASFHCRTSGHLHRQLRPSRSRTKPLLLNQGGATFAVQGLPTSASSLTSGAQQTLALEVSDLDGDGDMDVVVGHDRAHNEILVNDGSGNFVARALGSTTLTTDSLAVGDVDGDGLIDIVEGNAGDGEFADGTNYLHMNQGRYLRTGVEPFMSLALPSSDGASAYTNALKVGDVDGDGAGDIIVTNFTRPGWRPSPTSFCATAARAATAY